MAQCNTCLLSTETSATITLDALGVCNYCQYYKHVTAKLGGADERQKWIAKKLEEIRQNGKNKEFDCILGVSGGVDSTYLAYWVKQQGLRPLIAHFDNGWNSELATQNIQNICEKLGLQLFTIVINWEEFKELQLAYLRAGVLDIEVLTDHAIMATIYKIAQKYGIRYTINGFNYATEAIMPKDWIFDKSDWENIKDIYRQYGKGKPLKSYPHINFYRKLYYHWILKLESIQVLNYIPYNKAEAKQLIADRLNWRDYGGKHYESVFTKFYQAYILPEKFGVDKRQAHLSNLICSHQISKQDALSELKTPLYGEEELKQEKAYVLKKLGLSEAEFDGLMQGKIRKHTDFKTEKKLWKNYFRLINLLKFRFR